MASLHDGMTRGQRLLHRARHTNDRVRVKRAAPVLVCGKCGCELEEGGCNFCGGTFRVERSAT